MAWNRSSNIQQTETAFRRAETVRPTVTVRTAIAGAIVVLGAVLAACWLWPKEEHDADAASTVKPTLIKEVKPAKAPRPEKKPMMTPAVKTEEELRLEKIKYYERLFGTNMPTAIKAKIYFLKHPPKSGSKLSNPFDFLEHSSEQQIALVMSVEPGTYSVLRDEYGEEFDNNFITALLDKGPSKDDEDADRKVIRQNVYDVKKEIAEICKREGKKPHEVLNEYTTSLYDLGQFQRNLEEELDEIYNAEKFSDEDVKDFCTAANQMLEAKGLKPLPYPDLTERSFELHYNQQSLEETQE